MIWLWIGFLALIAALLALDLGVFHRTDHVIGTREALGWTAAWIALALAFGALVYFGYSAHWLGLGTGTQELLGGRQAAFKFLTGYLIEKSLSLDNIAVIALVFAHFRVPLKYQHRVLFWGIVGAVLMRAAMILAGAALIQRFDWMVYVFGALLLFTAFRMLRAGHAPPELKHNRLLALARRVLPVTDELHGHSFFTRVDGHRAATPLLLVLLLVETSDVIFAVDSIPAIFAVTFDPFLVFTSNIFAILGLRSLYFVLASLLDRFRHLKTSLVLVLAYVGTKMILSHHLPIPAWITLVVVAGALGAGFAASLHGAGRDRRIEPGSPDREVSR